MALHHVAALSIGKSKAILPSLSLLFFPFASATDPVSFTSMSIYKSSLCVVDDAEPFEQLDATFGDCKDECISSSVCSGMQHIDPLQCLLYDVPISAVRLIILVFN